MAADGSTERHPGAGTGALPAWAVPPRAGAAGAAMPPPAVPGPRRPGPEGEVTASSQEPSRAPAAARRPEAAAPPPPAAPAARRPRLGRWTRRHTGGLALTLAFIPVGMVSSAAVLGDEAPVHNLLRQPPRAPAGIDFDPGEITAPLSRHASLAARIPAGRVRVYRRPHTAAPSRRLRARRLEGRRLPLVMLVRARRRGWLQVDLPTRPNLSTGWILARTAQVRANPYRARVELRRHRLTVWRGGRVIQRAPIGVGRSLSPTPTGRYYLTDLVEAEDPGGLYGPYAFGLSAHSPVYTSFGAGDGQIGLHGTNDPAGLGQDVSSGCIRVSNRVIRRLARRLPLGTPVAIRR